MYVFFTSKHLPSTHFVPGTGRGKGKQGINYTNWFNKYFWGILCAMPSLDVLNMVINKEDTALVGIFGAM